MPDKTSHLATVRVLLEACPPAEDDRALVFGKSLLERAGMTGKGQDDEEIPEEYRRLADDSDDE